MAEYLTTDEARNYKNSGIDLIALVGTGVPRTWVQAKTMKDVPNGTVAYVQALGKMRRGAVVKTTRTKVHIALTTQGATYAPAEDDVTPGVRVQTVTAELGYVWIAPENLDDAHAEALAEDAERDLAGAKRAQAESTGFNRLVAGMTSHGFSTLAATRRALTILHAEALIEDAERHVARVNAREATEAEELLNFLRRTETAECGSCGAAVDRYTSTDGTTVNLEPGTEIGHSCPAIEEVEESSQPPRKLSEATGSTVVSLLERVWERIRADHPELPGIVIVTGSGLAGGKWGHFRPEGWRADGGKRHELFLAGEALAKGAAQVLQTMLHEGAHTLAEVRGVKDTSRQGRWHNATFRKHAEEMGLEHRGSQADKTHGFSFVTLTEATRERYTDLLEELDREIKLTCHLPAWMGGMDEEDRGGERIPAGPSAGGTGDGETKTSGNLKATCGCEEPVIIRLSKKVLDLGVVRCDGCGDLFTVER